MKRIALAGSTGSIGTQCIDVILHHSEDFEIIAIGAGHNLSKLRQQIDMLPSLQMICVAEEKDALLLSKDYPHLHVEWGDQGLLALAAWPKAELFVNALVGFRGLHPTLYAIEHGKDVALANKESLVTGGELVKEALKANHRHLYPIDSEHSAIFQCLQGNDPKEVRRLIITASGGSFRDKSREELVDVTVEEALAHPNWKMGGRITIDSATMMNKGLEVIEAHYLFDLPFDQIDVILHRESVIHSMVEYQDHAILAQLGSADMRLPIQYALSYPRRLVMHNAEPFHFFKYPALHFEELSFVRYPLLEVAYNVGRKKGNLGAILNGADECAVELFLHNKIRFLDIEQLVIDAVRSAPFIEHPTLEDLKKSDQWARDFVMEKQEGVHG